MTPQQTRALEIVKPVKNDDMRTRAVLLILANNIEAMAALRLEAFERGDIETGDWSHIAAAQSTMRGGLDTP
jgi:hypothetical protein